jgi:hypothetical protein
VCAPVRPFSWRTDQRHRPGLTMMVSTRQLHGFESINEQKLLLALDFLGAVLDLLTQPMALTFTTSEHGTAKHIPDFLAVRHRPAAHPEQIRRPVGTTKRPATARNDAMPRATGAHDPAG